jgi:small redox-active disulfide protein 2
VKVLGLDAEVEKITHLSDIMKFGVMMTPALAVDDQVKSAGKILSVEEIKGLLK